jgi:hypothetical protein
MPGPAKIISGPLQTERLSTGKRRLLRDLIVEVEGEQLTIPKDTSTDFSTIPWYGRILVRWSKVDIAGVVHDWLYQTGKHSKSHADRIWRLVAISGEHHANWFQAWACWVALSVGGWSSWLGHRRNDQGSGSELN